MELEIGQKVDLVVGVHSALGYTVLINETEEGLLYNNEVFKPLEEGMQTVGYIKNIREDGKIDVSLQPQGFLNVIAKDKQTIIDRLKQQQGQLFLTDKSSPDAVKFQLQMSKKAFKRALGALYKEKIVTILEDRIQLNS